MIIYEGPSMLDGAPIVAIATGLGRKSRNAKTGAMVQIWILRADVAPLAAIKDGTDASICGDCKHRGTSCYVNVGQAPTAVYKAYRAGRYQRADNLEDLFAGKAVRVGAYGDPAALPLGVVTAALRKAASWTGYTHQWRKALELAPYLMASADTAAERLQARMLGFRTFRVKAPSDLAMTGEIECLSDSAGVTCAACGLCAGQARPGKRDIWINVHGPRKAQFRAAA